MEIVSEDLRAEPSSVAEEIGGAPEMIRTSDPRFRKPFPAPHSSSLRLLPQHSGQRQQGVSADPQKELEWCGIVWSVVEVSTK